jgi:aminoglycoside 6-adenylyltransferase
MQPITFDYEPVIARLTAWADAEDNIRAAVVVGSRARTDHPADQWADLDAVIVARNPEPLWADATWLEAIGEPWLTFIEPTPGGRTYERRVLFAGGLDVDLVPVALASLLEVLDRGLAEGLVLLQRGARILVDKDGLAQRALEAVVPPAPPALPTEAQYLNVVHDFWFHTVWTAKHLRRGDLWVGKSCCDSYLKHLLLRMIEWHAQATRGQATDTWMYGRFMDEWADRHAVAALEHVFARYVEEEVWHALAATMDLFRWLAAETGQALGYGYPTEGAQQATELVQRMETTR